MEMGYHNIAPPLKEDLDGMGEQTTFILLSTLASIQYVIFNVRFSLIIFAHILEFEQYLPFYIFFFFFYVNTQRFELSYTS